VKAMTTHVKAIIIDIKDFVRSSVWAVQMQFYLVCAVDEAYDSDDINDKEVLLKNCDEIDMLTMLTEDNYRCERSLKVLDKNKNIMKNVLRKKSNI